MTIHDACSLITDGTHYSPSGVEEGVPFLTVKDMTSHALSFETAIHITRADFQRAAGGNSAPRLGDVLFSKDGTVGKVHVVREAFDFAVLSSIAILRPKPEMLDSTFFGHVLRSPAVLQKVANNKTGSALTRIVLKDLKRIRIPLPPIAEQRRIATVLDKADGIRRKRQESLLLLDDFLRSTFLEMFGDPVRNEKGWQPARLETLSEIVSGVTKGRKLRHESAGQVPYLRVANVQDGYLDLAEVKTIEATAGEIAQYLLREGDLLLTEGGDPDKLGRGAVWRGEIATCIHQNHIFRVRLTDHDFLPEYASALLGSNYGKRYFLKAAKQTTGIASINRAQLGGFPLLLAPLELQQRYATVASRVRALGVRLTDAVRVTDHLFNAVSQKVFQGGQ